jgi:(p)ppGpp synthase/HD superfamily hydrolase
LHRQQKRKGTQIPYLGHLLAVTALVIEAGGDEDSAIAALLHDAAEDQGGLETLEEIHIRFGERVAEIVRGCTDTFETPKPPWRPRKQAYLAHLRLAPAEVRRVSLADKVHNARSIVSDLLRVGNAVWERFTGGKDGTLWYYRSLIEVYRATDPNSPLTTELGWTVEKMEKLSERA